jgi:hypothetical protein
MEYAGGSLRLALESGVIAEAHAREVIECVRLYAFYELVEH